MLHKYAKESNQQLNQLVSLLLWSIETFVAASKHSGIEAYAFSTRGHSLNRLTNNELDQFIQWTSSLAWQYSGKLLTD